MSWNPFKKASITNSPEALRIEAVSPSRPNKGVVTGALRDVLFTRDGINMIENVLPEHGIVVRVDASPIKRDTPYDPPAG